MLIHTLKRIPKTTLNGYLPSADVSHNKWKYRDKGEMEVIFCDKEITLTEELKQYLLYFSPQLGKNCLHTIPSFSNLPIKGEQC